MIKKILIVFGVALIFIGIMGINKPQEKTEEHISVAEKNFSATEQTSPTPLLASTETPKPKETTPPTNTEQTSPIAINKAYFSIIIDGEEIPIAKGVDGETLKKSPGWLENSAQPGEEGVCVIYGHRNRGHLRALEGITTGDTITVLIEGDSIHYTVAKIEILDTVEEFTIPILSGKHLMISTCYPFRYKSSAPQKCIFWLSQK